MAEPLTLQSEQKRPPRRVMPYRVELRDAQGAVEAVIAEGGSAGVGYAAYYAAVREYFGRHLTLSCDGRRLASSGQPAV